MGGTLRRAAGSALACAVLAVPTAGCGDADAGENATVTVLAAASLTDVLPEAAAGFEEEHPGVTLRFSFAGSHELVAQIGEGLPADVLVTADQDTMDSISHRTDEVRVIAENQLTIVTAPGNPLGIDSLASLAESGVKTVLAAEDVPVGRYSREILDRAQARVSPVSEEASVRAVLSKVMLGEADAGIVYTTDAAAGGDQVTGVPLPDEQNVTAAYPAATLTDAPSPEEAADFLDWLSGGSAQDALTGAGFRVP